MPDAPHTPYPSNGLGAPAAPPPGGRHAIEALIEAVPGGDGAAGPRPDPLHPPLPRSADAVLRPLPRPFSLDTKAREMLPQTSRMLRSTRMAVSRVRVVWRLGAMTVLAAYLLGTYALDVVFIRDRQRRDARGGERLRGALESLGGALVKVGQQLSLRLDILPAAYCDALATLLDESEREIPFAYARARIEAAAGRPLEEVYRAFDPDPIGAATIACVYQAVRLDGARVAVKVRRPGIIKLFNTDLTVLDWVLRSVEFLTILRPGVSEVFRDEMRKLLLEELDFTIEARYQELFRRYHKKRKELNVTAPRVHHDLSGEDVMVSEFVEGIWVKDLIAALTSGDEESLAVVRALGIKPKKVAKHLVRASHYGLLECPFFHGDPHPGNIVIRPGNEIVMVDFGACGVFTEKERNLLRQMYYFKSRDDIGGMVQCVIALMEPLPPIDMEAFERDLQHEWWHAFYGIESRHAEWWERTSFRLWLALLGLVRKYEIPLPRHLLRMIRATLLYDTVAAQLYPKIDVFKEYRVYQRGVAKRVRKHIQRSAARQLLRGPDDYNYLRLARTFDTAELGMYRVRQFLDQRQPNFDSLTDKAWEFVSLLARMFNKYVFITTVAFLTALAVSLDGFGIDARWWDVPAVVAQLSFWEIPSVLGERLETARISEEVQAIEVVFGGWLVFMVGATLLYARRALFRFRDRDVQSAG